LGTPKLTGNCRYAAIRASASSDYFKYYVDSHPESANSYDSLGEAYKKSGEKKIAIQNYETSLKLNPDNHNAENMLRLLKDQKLAPADVC